MHEKTMGSDLRPKKVLLCHLYDDFSGSPKILALVHKSLVELGCSVLVMSGGVEGFLSEKAGIDVKISYQKPANRWRRLFAYLRAQADMFAAIFSQKLREVDVVYVNTMLPFGAAIAAKILGKQVIYHVHESSVRPILLKRFLRLVIQLTADKVIYVSRYLAAAEPFQNKPSHVLYNVLDKIKIDGLHAHSWGDRGRILMACSLIGSKGIFEFIGLAKECSAKYPWRFRLVLNAMQDEIDEFFGGHEFTENIEIVERQACMEVHYKWADVVLNLTRHSECVETFGMTILESLSYGRPVIVPKVGGPIEIVEDGVQGFCVSSDDLNGLKVALERIFADESRYLNMAMHAKKRSLDFGYDRFKDCLKRIVNDD